MSNQGTLDERYFTWLYSLVDSINNRDPQKSHWLLCEQLYLKPFEWFVPNDHNRAADGLELREDFIDQFEMYPHNGWIDLDCSMLEMLIALARRASYESDWTPDVWFWKMLENIDLLQYNDEVFHDGIVNTVNTTLEIINRRIYKPDGQGGLFPLRDPGKDQRKVEIWYQMSAYLLENDVMF